MIDGILLAETRNRMIPAEHVTACVFHSVWNQGFKTGK
jgi:hypothetical protein